MRDGDRERAGLEKKLYQRTNPTLLQALTKKKKKKKRENREIEKVLNE